MQTPTELLLTWLNRQLDGSAAEWLNAKLAQLHDSPTERDFNIAIGLTPRKLGKADLQLSEADLEQAAAARPGWHPHQWSIDQAARLLLLLSMGGTDDEFVNRLEQLFNTADVGELVAFYQGLPIYPAQTRYAARAAEGVRSNMRAVFEAVAHHNPYPHEQLDDAAWNQLVLKALFIGTTLAPIQGLDARSNPALMSMLCNYAHERWAAKRAVSPELWRCVGPHADENALNDLQRVLTTGDEVERSAAALALASCPRPEAKTLLDEVPALRDAVANGTLTWEKLAE